MKYLIEWRYTAETCKKAPQLCRAWQLAKGYHTKRTRAESRAARIAAWSDMESRIIIKEKGE